MTVQEDTDWDIYAYRQAHESDEHWQLKEEFMEAHKERIPEDRLVCLAQLYQNIELLGCKYPDETMRQVAELGRGICHNYKESKKTKLQRTFVKASDAAEARAKGVKRMKYEPELHQESNRNPSGREHDFPNREERSPNRDSGREDSGHKRKLSGQDNRTYSDSLKEQYGSMYNSLMQEDGPDSGGSGAGTSRVNEALPGNINMRLLATIQKYKKASNKSKKKAGAASSPSSNQSGRGLTTKNQRAQSQNQKLPQQGEKTYIMPGHYRRALAHPTTEYWESNNPLSQLIIIQREYSKQSLNAVGVLQGSADFCSIHVNYSWNPIGKVCSVLVKGYKVATVEGVPRKEAKGAVADRALRELIKHCYTIRILRTHDTEEHVSLQEVSGQGSKAKKSGMDKPVEENSMGSKLLKLMGWTGGGLGKEGKGITEPIKPVQVLGRDGLGLNDQDKTGVTPSFRDKIHGIVREFANGQGLGDLAFSSDFTKEQRIEIHKISHQYKLKSTSFGRIPYRYMVLSRKFSARHLLRTLLEKGPTDKYEVIPPNRR